MVLLLFVMHFCHVICLMFYAPNDEFEKLVVVVR